MASGSSQWRQLIRRKLTHPAQADGRAVARIAAQTWERVVSQVSPVIGDAGVWALYARSLHLTKAAFPRFANLNEKPSQQSFNDLLPRLESLNAAEAVDFSAALLITFAELLATLIGEGLTSRLTAPAWADESVAPDQTTPGIRQ